MIIRPAAPGDERALFDLIRGLARFEKLDHLVTGSAEALREHLFGARPVAEAILAEEAGAPVGFALFFPTYSTFLTKPGLYLEDLFVEPEHRGAGIGKALLRHLAGLAVERDCGRLEWRVLDWNAPSIAFYQSLGGALLPEWELVRMTEPEFRALAGKLAD